MPIATPTRRTHAIERGDSIAERTLRCLKLLPDGATVVALADGIDERISDIEQALDRLTKLGLVSSRRQPFTSTIYVVRP